MLGILLGQFATYISHGFHRTDFLALRIWVAGLFVLMLFKSLYGLALIHIQVTTNFLDLEGALRLGASTAAGLGYTWVMLSVYYVELFFCWRLWTLSRRLWIPGALALIFTAAIICGIFSNSLVGPKLGHIREWDAAYLIAVFVGDTLLSGSIIYVLHVSRPGTLRPRDVHRLTKRQGQSRQVTRNTASVLQRIAILTILCAAPAAVCSLVLIVSSQLVANWVSGGGALAVAIVSEHLLPKLYAFSAMWTLNARKAIRAELDGAPGWMITQPFPDTDSIGRGADRYPGQPRGIRSMSPLSDVSVKFGAPKSPVVAVPMGRDEVAGDDDVLHSEEEGEVKRRDI
ncbi:unnamed protein product [Mycena citricolor]|uniref:DUF6534 domain-containing protein n=1 Tax=Mycena citricolor TaxID=2018698 RepID=A0AAD2H798_9AGAR|nr:unnamed protein product [Mycena citricolor]